MILRDALSADHLIFYGCELKEASNFGNLKPAGDGPFVSWPIKQFGANDSLVAMARADQQWITEIIGKRNGVEHPGGHSGTLKTTNIRVHPTQPNAYISPTWERSRHGYLLDNLLRLAEDHLVAVVRRSDTPKILVFYQIPEAERNEKKSVFPLARTPSPFTQSGRKVQPALTSAS